MGAHRYWRLDVSATQSGTNVALSELVLRVLPGGADVAVGATATASATTANGPTNAVDGASGTFWGSGGAAPQWLAVDLGVPRDIAEYAIIGTAASGTSPKAFTLSWSDNGSAYTVADTQTAVTWTAGQTNTFEVPGTGYQDVPVSSSWTGWGFFAGWQPVPRTRRVRTR